MVLLGLFFEHYFSHVFQKTKNEGNLVRTRTMVATVFIPFFKGYSSDFDLGGDSNDRV